jgi:hypothetical protein
MVTDENCRIQILESEVRIRIKMSRIRNTDNIIFQLKIYFKFFFSALTFYWFCTNVVSCTQASLLRSVPVVASLRYFVLFVLRSFRGLYGVVRSEILWTVPKWNNILSNPTSDKTVHTLQKIS